MKKNCQWCGGSIIKDNYICGSNPLLSVITNKCYQRQISALQAQLEEKDGQIEDKDFLLQSCRPIIEWVVRRRIAYMGQGREIDMAAKADFLLQEKGWPADKEGGKK